MANLLQSAQVKSTCAPQYYNDYLSNLANAGRKAQEGAQYVGAQPLQEQAFNTAAQNAGQYQPYFQAGACLATQAAGQDIQGAAQPFLCAAAGSGGLSAANPYLNTAAMINPAMLAQCYMNPYINTAVQQMSDIGQRNIQRNLSPQATAAAVGSGQFGSQRGAQVLGQVQSDAQRDLDSQISQMLSSGYGQALQAAGQKNALLGQLGQTAGSLQQQQAGVLGQLGSTAGSLAGQKAQTLNQAGQTIGQLGTAGQNANLACINALATLGGQQQTIGQNEQLFPMSTLSQLSQLLQGYNIPVSTKTTLCKSGIENIGSIAGLLGNATQKNPLTGESLVDKFLGKIFNSTGNGGFSGTPASIICNMFGGAPNNANSPGNFAGCGGFWCGVTGNWVPQGATGGLVSTNAIGCASTQYRGALPKE
jgi:hypothetical protein